MSKRTSRRELLLSRRDRALSPRQRLEKANLLDAISSARMGKENLEEALIRRGINPKQILAETDAIKRVRGKLQPKVHDKIPRSLRFYENRKLCHAEVANSKVASDIGRYWNAIGELTLTGRSTTLRRLRRQRFKDIDGRFHTLEKNPKVILELEARKPKPESFEIYKRR